MQLPPQDVVWQGRLSAPVDGAGTIMLERLTMRADHLTATAQGMLDPTTLGGEAQVALTVDALAPFAERYGQPVDGTAELQANLALGAGAEVISIDLYGGAHELSGLPDGLGALLGPVLTLEANAIVVPDDSVEVTHLRVEGTAATLDGRLELGLPRQTLEGALSIDLDNLAPLSPLLGLELDGPLTAQAQLGGAMHKPAIELAARSPGLLIAGEQLDALTLAASVEGTREAADGKLRLAATARDVAAELAAAVELRRPQLRLTDVSLSAPRTRASGNLSIDLERRLVEGELTGRIEQLRALAALLPARLAGALEFEARASAKDGAQDGRPDGARPRPRGRFRRLGQFELRGSVADALQCAPRHRRPRQLLARGRPDRPEARRLRDHRVRLRLRHGDGEVLRHRLPQGRADAERGRAGGDGAGAQAPRRHRGRPARRLRAGAWRRSRRASPTCAVTWASSKTFGLPCVVAVNRRPGDTDEEVELVRRLALEAGAHGAEVNDGFARGGEGAAALAEAVADAAEQPNDFPFTYDDDDPIQVKIGKVAKKVYGAKEVVFYLDAQRKMRQYHEDGLDKLPICMAKTHLSLSADPALLNAPEDFELPGPRHPRLHRRRLARAALRRHPADAGTRQAAGGVQRRHRRRGADRGTLLR